MSADENHDSPPANVKPSLKRIVNTAIMKLQSQVTGAKAHDQGPARARMASLRSGVGRSPGEVPLAWGEVAQEVLPDFPPHWSYGDEATAEERAAFTALTFWALHQQSQEMPMHAARMQREYNFGHSVGRLAVAVESKSIKSRFDALLLNTHGRSTRQHLRSLIQLLRGHEIQVDYAQLAEDLRDLGLPRLRKNVILRWGRGYAQTSSPTPRPTPDNTTSTTA